MPAAFKSWTGTTRESNLTPRNVQSEKNASAVTTGPDMKPNQEYKFASNWDGLQTTQNSRVVHVVSCIVD